MITMMNYDEAIKLVKSLDVSPDNDSWQISMKLSEVECVERIRVSDGASKICLIPENSPFVIKWSEGRDTTEAMDEVRIYQQAVEENLEMFFPKTAFLCRINDVDFVVQEKIDSSCDDLSIRKYKQYQKIAKTAKGSLVRKMEREFHKASRGYRRCLNETWAKMALVIYGKRACLSLEKFIIEHSINDLHDNNVGYKNNKPIILDFSGYHR